MRDDLRAIQLGAGDDRLTGETAERQTSPIKRSIYEEEDESDEALPEESSTPPTKMRKTSHIDTVQMDDIPVSVDNVSDVSEDVDPDHLHVQNDSMSWLHEKAVQSGDDFDPFALSSSDDGFLEACLLYTSPSPRDLSTSRMPSSA